jgi:hypothetical protein
LISSTRTTFFFLFFFFQDVYVDYTQACGFEIKFSAGVLTLTSVCQSGEQRLLHWVDPNPLDIVYYRFGTWQLTSEFHVHTGKALAFSFLN